MSRNQFKDSRSLQWVMVLKWMVIVGFLLVLGLSYILCKNQTMRLAEEAIQQKVELAKINRINDQIQNNINLLEAPQNLQRRVGINGLISTSELTVIHRDGNWVASR